MNLTIVPSAFDFLRKGSALTKPGLWKLIGAGASGGIGSAALLSDSVGDFALSLSALAKGFGYDLHLDENSARAIGVVIAWAVGMFFTVATTDKLGILPAKPAVAGTPGDAPTGSIDDETREKARVWAEGQADPSGQNNVRGG